MQWQALLPNRRDDVFVSWLEVSNFQERFVGGHDAGVIPWRKQIVEIWKNYRLLLVGMVPA